MSETYELGKKLIAAGRSQMVITLLVAGSLFVAQVGIIRRFGFQGLGEYTVTSLAIYLVSIATVVAVPLAIGRRVGHLHEGGDESGSMHEAGVGFFVVLVLASIGGMALGAVWGPIARAFLRDAMPSYWIAIAVLGSAMISCAGHILQSRLQISAMGLVLITQPLGIVLALGWDTLFPGVRPSQMAVVGFISGGSIGVLGLLIIGARPQADRHEFARLFRLGIGIAPVVYTNVLSNWADRLVVSIVLGPVGVGVYQAASVLAEGSFRLLRGAGSFFVSAYARASVYGDAHPVRLRRLHVRLWSAYAAVMTGALVAGADGIVTLVYGADLPTLRTPLTILAMGLVPTAVSLTLLTAGAGLQQDPALRIARVAIPGQFILGAALAAAAGVVGVAIAQLVVTLASGLAQLQWSGDQELALPGTIGVRLAALALLATVLALAIQLLPIPWALRALAGAAVSAGLAMQLLLGSDERLVARRLVAFWA